MDKKRWKHYPWDLVTSVAWAGGDIICKAHQNGARVIAAAPTDMPLTNDKAVRAKWTRSVVQMVKDNFVDGVTFDYEEPIAPGDPKSQYYVAIVNETNIALKAESPGY